MKRFFRNYSLSTILFALFIASWIGQYYFQWQQFVNETVAHGQDATLQAFLPEFWSATLENWQSEFLQLFSFVVLTTYFIHRNSHESRDSSDKMQASLDRIEKKVSDIKKSSPR